MKNLIHGQVKTRIGGELGDETAFEIYQQLVDYTLQIAQSLNIETYIYFSQFLPVDPLKKHLPFKYKVQSPGGDLGEKMSNAFKEQFINHSQVIIIGSDCLQLTSDIILKAFSSLEDHEAVIGPSLDGGYYLLGITKYIKELFVDIPWSTDRVLDLTKSILEEKNISYKVLQPLKDIDYAADWHAQKHLLR